MKKIMAVLLLIFTCVSLLGGAACHYAKTETNRQALTNPADAMARSNALPDSYIVHPLIILDISYK